MSTKPDEPIARFDGLIYKVSTLAAGGFRITLDGTSQDIAQAAYLMPFADTPGVLMRVTFERVKQVETDARTHRMETRSKRKSQWTPAEEPRSD